MKEETLTIEHIKKAIQTLKDNSENDRKFREERSLKDFTKLNPFFEELRKSDMSSRKQAELRYVIEMLAQGYYLVMGEKLHELAEKELVKLKVPQEIIDNIYKSVNLPSSRMRDKRG